MTTRRIEELEKKQGAPLKYINYRAKALEKIEALQAYLNSEVDPEKISWGKVGNLAHVNEVLGEIVDFVSGANG